MSDLETEFPNSDAPFEEKNSHFTQTGHLNDPSLIQLRDQIKNVMIPLLIKTFQFKSELSQLQSQPSRLQNQKKQRSPEEIFEQLKALDNDLKVLLLWCQSCRSQIQKALCTPEEEQKTTLTAPSTAATHPVITKSFTEAVFAQSSIFQQQPPMYDEQESFFEESRPSAHSKSWWEKLTKKL